MEAAAGGIKQAEFNGIASQVWLLDPSVYEALVREAYKSELQGKILNLNPNVARIAKRIDLAFGELGIPFHKTRPSHLFLSKMATDLVSVLPKMSAERFEALFKLINQRLEAQVAKRDRPFRVTV